MTSAVNLEYYRVFYYVAKLGSITKAAEALHLIVTEYGLADLRGKSPKERAELIIEKCCAPEYKDNLRAYFEHAKEVAPGQQTPHDLTSALSWHIRYLEKGTMKEEI